MNYIQRQYPADVGTHACNMCPEQFAVSSGLLVHKLTSHSSSTKISALLIDLLENEVLNSSDEDYCYSFVFTTTYYRYPNTTIKTEAILEEDAIEINDAMHFEVDLFEESKPIIEDSQRPASPESTITETAPKESYKRNGNKKMRKMCPICHGRFHPQGLYRHIRQIHNTRYTISKGRARLVRSTDFDAEKPGVPLEGSFVETQPDVPFVPKTEREIDLKQTPKTIANRKGIRKNCPICGDRFHPQGLYRHMRAMHNIKYSVRGARQTSNKTIVMMPHESNDEVDHSLPSADTEFVVEDPLQKQAPTLPEVTTKRSTSHKLRKMCPICYRRFHPQGLYRHLKVMHNTVYSTASRYKTRTSNESNIETSFVACDVPPETVEIKPEVDTDVSELVSKEETIKRCHKIRKATCPICFVHLHPQGIYRHLLTVHNTRYSVAKGKFNLRQTTVEELSTNPAMIQKRRKCPICNKFYHKHGLSRHLLNAHGRSKDEISDMYKTFRGQPINPLIPPIEAETVVDRSHKSQFVCPMCDEKLDCQSSYRQHLRQIHQFPISTTDKLLYLKHSTRILKSNLRPCPLCGCGLHPQSITRHLRSVHKSSKEEVLALSRLMRVEQKRREAQIRKYRKNTDDPTNSINPVL